MNETDERVISRKLMLKIKWRQTGLIQSSFHNAKLIDHEAKYRNFVWFRKPCACADKPIGVYFNLINT
ncbi:hypothetical protein BLOT_015157 [Blomia tropicalis]|nr:hypothetical protein BLOT_015157 [Blomia tropicalis]